MSSYDKVVKLACKPKAAPPKAKYIDPIIAATWSDDGAVHDVCKALSPRIREPNAIVVFKALIVLHTMIRNGATDNVLTYLSSSEVLRLRNVSTGNWEGYAAPVNLQNYALYLDSRIRAYKDLKHDAVKVQAESNRDMRNSVSIEEEGYRGRKDRPTVASVPSRSKTIMGRKLRSMTVEKGLLRETKAVHNMIDTLVECRFYLDDLEDELTITALRMLVKDLLILFQAGNEGVINVLENYFEMSHVDAEEALTIYRHFCKQTEFVVEYLGVAKKLQNLLNVSVPNLKHAPVSLAGALQEYLEDPNFEQNRIEYKTTKNVSERAVKPSTTGKKLQPAATTSSQPNGKVTSPKVSFASPAKDRPSSSEAKIVKQGGNDINDFFNSIEEGQPTMFNPQTNSPNTVYFQQQQAPNPFAQMPNGQPLMQQPHVSAQPTGFLVAQHTAMPQPNPFGNFLTPQAPQQTGHRPFSTYLPQQPTGFIQQPQATGLIQPQAGGFTPRPQQGGLLQPQATGSNPFRQSMLMPQTTGMALFGGTGAQGQFPVNQGPAPQGAQAWSPSFSQSPSSSTPAAPKPSLVGPGLNDIPARPASTPLTSSTSAPLQPVKTHQTGTKNPFGPIVTAQPPVPKAPTLFELSNLGSFNPYQGNQQQPQQQQPQQQQQQPPQLQQQQFTGFGAFSFENSALNPGATDISSVASSFSFSNASKPNTKTATTTGNSMTPLSSQSTSNTATTTASGSTFPDSLFSASLASQPTGTTNSSFSPSGPASSAAALKPHLTGFSGLKAFKPSSSFGASLMESLPPIPGSGSTTPAVPGLPSQTGTSLSAGSTFSPSSTASPTQNGASPNNYNFLSSQPTGATGGFGGNTPSFGSTLGVGLRPQMTGGGSANPFRASTIGNVGQPNFGASGFQQTGVSQPFSANMFGVQQQQQQQQQQQHANTPTSLI